MRMVPLCFSTPQWWRCAIVSSHFTLNFFNRHLLLLNKIPGFRRRDGSYMKQGVHDEATKLIRSSKTLNVDQRVHFTTTSLTPLSSVSETSSQLLVLKSGRRESNSANLCKLSCFVNVEGSTNSVKPTIQYFMVISMYIFSLFLKVSDFPLYVLIAILLDMGIFMEL